MDTVAAIDSPRYRKQSTTRTLIGTGIGNAVEWFDWNVYAAFAVYFATQIFDSGNPQSAFLQTMAVFAVGFVARPFGSFVFGWIGRRSSLTLAVFAGSAGSLLIAVCPTYDQVGWIASALLVLARLIQGLAHGGELPSAQTYLAEHAPRERRGLFASAIYISGTIGLLAGLLLGLGVQAVLSEEQMAAWGWRAPFVVGALLGVVALSIRRSMAESEVFEEHQAQTQAVDAERENIFAAVFRNWSTGLQVIFMTAGITVSYYSCSVTVSSIARTSFGYTPGDAFSAAMLGNLFLILVLPVWGLISDRIGRRPATQIGMLGSAALWLPMIQVAAGGQMWQLAVATCVQVGLLAAFLSHAPATYAEMFPTAQRASGFGIYYAIAIALFGGTAGYVFAWIGDPRLFGLYSMGLLVIAAITVWFLPETKGRDLSQG